MPTIPSELIAAVAAWVVVTLLHRSGVNLPFMTVPTGQPDDPKTPEDESRKPYNPLDGLDWRQTIQMTVLEVISQVFKKAPADVHSKIEAALSDLAPPPAGK